MHYCHIKSKLIRFNYLRTEVNSIIVIATSFGIIIIDHKIIIILILITTIATGITTFAIRAIFITFEIINTKAIIIDPFLASHFNYIDSVHCGANDALPFLHLNSYLSFSYIVLTNLYNMLLSYYFTFIAILPHNFTPTFLNYRTIHHISYGLVIYGCLLIITIVAVIIDANVIVIDFGRFLKLLHSIHLLEERYLYYCIY